MANEFIARKGIISLDSIQVSGSITATGGITVSGSISSASFATSAATASSADNFFVRQNLTASSALFTGSITAQTLVVQTVTSSIVYSSGSNIFGNLTSNVQQFTGSVRITGSLNTVGIACFSNVVCTPTVIIRGTTTGATANASANRLVIDDTENGLSILSSTAGAGYINFGDSANNSSGQFIYDHSADALRIFTSASEKMRITSAGIACFSNTVCVQRLQVFNTNSIIVVEGTATNGEGTVTIAGKNSSGTSRSAIFKYDNADIIRISTADAIPMRFETSDVTRLTIASTGIATFACQVCAPYFLSPGASICGTNGNTWLSLTDLRDSNNAETTALHINTAHRSGGLNGVNHYGLRVTPNFSTNSSNLGTVYGAFITPFETGVYNIDTAFGLFVKAVCVCSGTLTNSFAAVFLCGNVGIGTSSPSYSLDVSGRIRAYTASSGVSPRTDLGGTIIAEGSTRAGLYILTGGTSAGSYGSIWWGNGNTNTDGSITVQNDTRAMIFGTADGERMRITSGGNVGINTTDPKANFHVCGGSATLRVGPWFSTNDRDFIQLEASGTDTRILSPNERFKIENPDGCVQIVSGTSGGVQLTPGATSWASMSDIRKKKNFESTQGLAALLQIEPVKYHFQWDNDCMPKRMGFIAQNIQPLIPEMVSKTDEKAEDGSDYLTITSDYILPVLVKAIQEQQCQICTQSIIIDQLKTCLGII